MLRVILQRRLPEASSALEEMCEEMMMKLVGKYQERLVSAHGLLRSQKVCLSCHHLEMSERILGKVLDEEKREKRGSFEPGWRKRVWRGSRMMESVFLKVRESRLSVGVRVGSFCDMDVFAITRPRLSLLILQDPIGFSVGAPLEHATKDRFARATRGQEGAKFKRKFFSKKKSVIYT